MTAINAPASLSQAVPSPAEQFRADILGGLTAPRKRISSKHLYDKRGSELFDQICELDEYYVTRCELEAMRRHAGEIIERLPSPMRLVEFGSGSSLKTRLLLDHLDGRSVYLPVDVSSEHLAESCAALRREYPGLTIQPVCGDFTGEFQLPSAAGHAARTVAYFPGSTIGNFEEAAAVRLLQRMRRLCGDDGAALVGIDLRKDARVLHAAYNDRAGVTAEFTKNLLRRINKELDAGFELSDFDYHANYNAHHGRIEASLVSRREQRVTVGGRPIRFAAGESIHTEYSHKYTIPQFSAMADRAGFEVSRQWSDVRRYFAVLLLRPTV